MYIQYIIIIIKDGVWGIRWISSLPVKVPGWAAKMGAWAGSEWRGAFGEPCDLAAVSLVHSVKQTSAFHHASSEGRHKCCNHFPLCAPWTCSSGCTSPVIRRRHTERWTQRTATTDCYSCLAIWGQFPSSQRLIFVVAIKYFTSVCIW